MGPIKTKLSLSYAIIKTALIKIRAEETVHMVCNELFCRKMLKKTVVCTYVTSDSVQQYVQNVLA